MPGRGNVMRENRDEMEIQIIRSGRKTLGLQLYPDGRIVVRAPYGVPQSAIDAFVREKASWISRKQKEMAARNAQAAPAEKLTREELHRLADQACRLIPERVAYYAPKVGVTYGRITIRNQRTRWGSCSSKGNLNFNCLLMLAPPEVLDSVVVHELCHRLEMNHSKRFYENVLRVYPEYWKWNAWLKEHGRELMGRMT